MAGLYKVSDMMEENRQSILSIAGMTMARLGVVREKYNVASFRICKCECHISVWSCGSRYCIVLPSVRRKAAHQSSIQLLSTPGHEDHSSDLR